MSTLSWSGEEISHLLEWKLIQFFLLHRWRLHCRTKLWEGRETTTATNGVHRCSWFWPWHVSSHFLLPLYHDVKYKWDSRHVLKTLHGYAWFIYICYKFAWVKIKSLQVFELSLHAWLKLSSLVWVFCRLFGGSEPVVTDGEGSIVDTEAAADHTSSTTTTQVYNYFVGKAKYIFICYILYIYL